jgi:hypothetical protein
MYSFLVLLILLSVIYGLTVEGFESRIKMPTRPYTDNIQIKSNCSASTSITPVSQELHNDSDGVNPYDMPGQLPVAGYGQIAAMSPLPYQDTTLVKANHQQLISLLELLKGFLAFEAQELDDRSDPSIQLPLQTARSDFHVLQREVSVQNRNPGIQSTITLSTLNEMSSNLAYLQQQVRLIGSAGTLKGSNQIEGFVSAPPPRITAPNIAAPKITAPKMSVPAIPIISAPKVQLAPGTNVTLSKVDATGKVASTSTVAASSLVPKPAVPASVAPTTASGAPGAGTVITAPTAPVSNPAAAVTATSAPASTGNQIATVQDLTNFMAKIQGEILRLSANGTTDPIMKARVKQLTDMKASVQQIVDQVKKGTLMSTEIPIMKADIDKALPILGKPSEPLPQIIKTLGLPPGLANALPGLSNDPNTSRQIAQLIDKYAQQVVDGVSASLNITYKSKNDAQNTPKNGQTQQNTPNANARTQMALSSIAQSGFPSPYDLNNVSGSRLTTNVYQIRDELAADPSDMGRGPSHFDWKARAKAIEDQVKKRGLKPTDFGITPHLKPSRDFSWKGYAQMICTRLQATMDPALPETCGCPPLNWKGWRN